MEKDHRSKKVVFLDRDGVINKDSPDYIKNWNEFRFLPGSLDAIKILTENNFKIILITNQSAINRKLASKEAIEEIFVNMKAAISAQGGKITDIFYCPHTPDDRCSCRKPSPGLILKAAATHSIDFSIAFMVGDSVKDIQCAKSAGCRYTILVQTGNGIQAQKDLAKKNILPDHIAEDLYNAALWIIRQD